MIYTINEGNENNVSGYNVIVEDFSYLIKNDYKTIILSMIKESQLLRMINFPQHIIDLIEDIIINDKDINYLNEELTKNSVPLYSLIIGLVNNYKNKYKKLLEINNAEYIIIKCNKNNFIKGLELAKHLNKKVIIEGRSISLSDYKQILSNYDISSLNGYNIKIDYQEQNYEINVSDLYNISSIVEKTSKEIEKYNLSPIEKIIYVYDIVKKNIYKKSDKDISECIVLDKVLHSDFIVCGGYSNLFNAILKNLEIKAIPLISVSANHQRSLVYIEDNKYNIKGVYVFDPTFDSRKDNNYINNYAYFGFRLKDSEKDCPCDIYKVISLSFNNVLKLYENENVEEFEANIDVINTIDKLIKFIDGDYDKFNESIIYYEFSSESARSKTLEIYQNYIDKYNPKEIEADTFMMALYYTRMIQFYNGIVDSFDIDDIKEAAKNRSIYQGFNYSDKEDIIEKMFEAIKNNNIINSSLCKIVHNNSGEIEKNQLNVRLLKVLRNSKK